MVEKAKRDSSLVARRGGNLLLGPAKKSYAKKASLSVAKRRSPNSSPANPTEFKGVRMRAWGKWVTEIRDPDTKERIWLGSFATAEMAARAYDAGVVCLKLRRVSYCELELPQLLASNSLAFVKPRVCQGHSSCRCRSCHILCPRSRTPLHPSITMLCRG
jgi:hypothetical protein